MRYLLAILLSSIAAAPPLLAADGPDSFVGRWLNADTATRGVTQVEIASTGAAWTIQAWGKCHPTDCAWGPTSLSLLADSVQSSDFRYGFASWDMKFVISHMSLRLDGRELVAETFDIFLDGSQRSNLRALYRFKRPPPSAAQR